MKIRKARFNQPCRKTGIMLISLGKSAIIDYSFFGRGLTACDESTVLIGLILISSGEALCQGCFPQSFKPKPCAVVVAPASTFSLPVTPARICAPVVSPKRICALPVTPQRICGGVVNPGRDCSMPVTPANLCAQVVSPIQFSTSGESRTILH